MVFTLIMGALICKQAFAKQKVPEKTAPPYQLLRQDEDWSIMAKEKMEEGRDLFDPIKYVPLNADGDIWVSFGGQLRGRIEAWNHFNFGAPEMVDDSDVFLLTRFLFHGDLHLGEYVRLFAQGKSSSSTGRDLVGGRRITDADELDLQNGFVDINLSLFHTGRFTLRVGRQEMIFGKQRLVGPLDWANTRRTFDGASGIFGLKDWKITGFWTQPVVVLRYDFNEKDSNTDFFGIYANNKALLARVGVDLYWLGLRKDFAVFNRTAGPESRHTLGSRIYGKISDTGIDCEFEGAYQFGEVGEADIRAFMVTWDVGYSFRSPHYAPRIYLGFDYASGDNRAGDNKVGTFNQLFPTGHAYLGYIDTVGRQNIIDLRTGGAFKPHEKLAAALELHYFWRADSSDALYNAGGAVVRPGAAGSSRKIGAEIDLTFKYQFDRHTLIQSGYSRFFAGDFIKESGPSEDIDFGYLLAQFTF
jgi:hypothetical protein